MKLSRSTNFLNFLPVLGIVLLIVAGCSHSSPVVYTSFLRIVNASANAAPAPPSLPGFDILDNHSGLVANLNFSYASPYIGVSPTSQKIGVYPAGTAYKTPLFSVTSVATPAGSYTSLYVINDLATIAPLTVTDNLTPPSAGNAEIRLLQLAPDFSTMNSEVDVYVTAPGFNLTKVVPPIVVDNINVFVAATAVPYAGIDANNGISGYIALPANATGTKYELQLFPAGTIDIPANAAIDFPFTLKTTQIRTILALDKPFSQTGTPKGFQASMLNDLN